MKPEQTTPTSARNDEQQPTPALRPRNSGLSETRPLTADTGQVIREKALEILRREYPGRTTPPPEREAPPRAGAGPATSTSATNIPQPLSETSVSPGPIPARMLNEFVYCPRLFYYEFVEGVFVESADTLRGAAIHSRVDSGSGALPKPGAGSESQDPTLGTARDSDASGGATESGAPIANQKSEIANEPIHSGFRAARSGRENGPRRSARRAG